MTVTCSAIRAQTNESLAGTAPHARLWVLLEQPGPWGRDALVESHLPSVDGHALAALAAARPVRVGLIRSVGAHPDVRGGARTLLLARTDAGASWIAARSVADVGSLHALLDVDALLNAKDAPTNLPGEQLPAPANALLVCTNAKRDQCCAVLGRPMAASMATAADARTQVWETSHTGGHRFAPTFVSLPDGYLYGGPDAESRSLDACRGRSSLPPAGQAAELAVLRRLGASAPRPLEVHREDDGRWRVTANGRHFLVAVEERPGIDRPESCGKAAVPSHTWQTAIS
ncbi:MAG: sucrase ferredoxin [Actinomycetia bacterium]|nr:sucrase ferredoxin [Actinomycetes bacterium]